MIKTYVYIDVYTGAVYTGAWGRRRPRLEKGGRGFGGFLPTGGGLYT